MNLLNVVNWIGVLALMVGALISAVSGGFISALFAVLLTSILVTSLIPINGKLRLILRGIPRIEIVQTGARWIGTVGCWVLAGMGGWEYVPAAVVLTGAMIAAVGVMIKEMRERRRTGSIITSIPAIQPSIDHTKPGTNLSTSLTTPQAPPQYTSTVRLVEEKPVDTEVMTVKIIQEPVFNV